MGLNLKRKTNTSNWFDGVSVLGPETVNKIFKTNKLWVLHLESIHSRSIEPLYVQDVRVNKRSGALETKMQFCTITDDTNSKISRAYTRWEEKGYRHTTCSRTLLNPFGYRMARLKMAVYSFDGGGFSFGAAVGSEWPIDNDEVLILLKEGSFKHFPCFSKSSGWKLYESFMSVYISTVRMKNKEVLNLKPSNSLDFNLLNLIWKRSNLWAIERGLDDQTDFGLSFSPISPMQNIYRNGMMAFDDLVRRVGVGIVEKFIELICLKVDKELNLIILTNHFAKY